MIIYNSYRRARLLLSSPNKRARLIDLELSGI